MDAIEKAMKLSIWPTQSALETALNEEKRRRVHIVHRLQISRKCKSLANFPWMVTPCCRIILCWLDLGSSCPHCRASIESGTCSVVQQIQPLHTLISQLSWTFILITFILITLLWYGSVHSSQHGFCLVFILYSLLPLPVHHGWDYFVRFSCKTLSVIGKSISYMCKWSTSIVAKKDTKSSKFKG